jgi:photosystem II stability/assembly factor-like uncharacterized protein
MAIMPDNPQVMFVGNGDSIPGLTGVIQRSSDGGASWQPANLPTEPNSVVYWFGVHPDVQNVVVGASLYGYVYVSEDSGESWQKLQKEFGEIRSVALTPN